MADMMNGLNAANFDPKQATNAAIDSTLEMQKILSDFTKGQSAAHVARFAALAGEYKKFEELKAKLAEEGQLNALKKELESANTSAARKKELIQQIADEEQRITEVTLNAMASAREKFYKQATTLHKAEMKIQQADAIASARKSADAEYKEKWTAAQGDSKARRKLTNDHKKYVVQSIKEENAAREQALKLQQSATGKQFKELGEKMKSLKNDKSLKNVLDITVSIGKINADSLKQLAKEQKAVYEASKEEVKRREEQLDELKEAGFSEDSKEYQEAKQALRDAEQQKNVASALKTASESLAKVSDSFNDSFKKAEDMLNNYKGIVDGRLQGSETSYNKAMDKITSLLSMSPYVKSTAVIESMKELAEGGIAYNLEQRAFLMTISDKIASTFDAFDSNLTRLIRLQQADTTAARLGMEASLTKFLNNMFQDSSYLKDVYDSVSAAIIDANATMTRNASAEFEYTVQKWLGSLSSLGMSSDTINQIATGINYLATGDVNSLASNTQLQTLFAMSAANAGLEYSELLLNGLDSSNTNKLLQSMVTYLKSIAENSSNQVVRAAYGDVFNLSMSDMKAISNLTAQDISNISGNSLAYGGMMSELNYQFGQLSNRTSMSEMLNNIYENAVFGVASDMVNNPVTYGMYKMLHFMQEQDLNWNLPSISAAGFGVDLEANIQDLLNLGLMVGQSVSLVTNILGAFGSGGGTNLEAWGGTEYTSRGSGMTFSTAGLSGGKSGSTYVAAGNSTDMKNSSINSATDDAEESGKITNKNADPGYTLDDFYKAVVEGSEPYIRVEEKLLPEVYMGYDKYLSVRDARMNYRSSSLLVADSTNTHDKGALIVYDSQVNDAVKSVKKAFNDVFDSKSLIENGAIQVVDKGTGNLLTSLFGTGALIIDTQGRVKTSVLNDSAIAVSDNSYTKFTESDGRVKVNMTAYDIGSKVASSLSTTTIKVKPEGASLAVKVTNASDIKQSATSTVSLASGTSITIDKETLKQAFREAMGMSSTATVNEKSIQTLLNDISNGNIKVKVTGTDGFSIPVTVPSQDPFYRLVSDLG